MFVVEYVVWVDVGVVGVGLGMGVVVLFGVGDEGVEYWVGLEFFG